MTTIAFPHEMPDVKEDVLDDAIIDQLHFAVQCNAAVYSCASLGPSTQQDPVRCPLGSCPDLEAHNASYLLRFTNTNSTKVSGYVAVDRCKPRIVIAFRAAQDTFDSWVRDSQQLTTMPTQSQCKVHPAFLAAWQSVRTDVMGTLRDYNMAQKAINDILVVGRGLGGSIAAIAALDLRSLASTVDLASFAAPAAGDRAFAQLVSTVRGYGGMNYRFVSPHDAFQRMPPEASGFVQFNNSYTIDDHAPQDSTSSQGADSGVSTDEQNAAIQDYDSGWPLFKGNILGEIPEAVEAAVKRAAYLASLPVNDPVIRMHVKDRVPFDGETWPWIWDTEADKPPPEIGGIPEDPDDSAYWNPLDPEDIDE